MTRLLRLCCLLALLALGGLLLRNSQRAPDRPAAAPGGPGALDAPEADGALVLAAGGAGADSAQAANPVERAAVEPLQAAARADALRVLCAATGKGVPALELEFSDGERSALVTCDVAGRVVPPSWAGSESATVRSASTIWGLRDARLLTRELEAAPERAPVADVLTEERTLLLDAPSFVLIELPGAQLQRGYAPYGDFDHREVLGPELLLAIDTVSAPGLTEPRRPAFELRGNREQWVANGSVEREAQRIVTERVVVEREARCRLEVVLLDAEGEPFRPSVEVLLRDPASGEQWQDRVQDQRPSFRGLRPGTYEVGGSSTGQLFGPERVELPPFERTRVELRAREPGLEALTLELTFEASSDQDLVEAQLPRAMRLQAPPGQALVVLQGGERRAARSGEDLPWSQLRWSGAGGQWIGHARFEHLLPGGYRPVLDPVLPRPELLEEALERTGLALLPERVQATGTLYSSDALRDSLWVHEDCELRRPLILAAPVLVELEVRGGLDGATAQQIARGLMEPLGLPTQLAFSALPDGSRGLYLGATRVPPPGDFFPRDAYGSRVLGWAQFVPLGTPVERAPGHSSRVVEVREPDPGAGEQVRIRNLRPR